MKKALLDGPFSCSYFVNQAHRDYKNPEGDINIFNEKKDYWDHNHVVSVVGWGIKEKTNEKYWIVKNSWGRFYGDDGFFYLQMGMNTLGFEANCAWADPEFVENNLLQG